MLLTHPEDTRKIRSNTRRHMTERTSNGLSFPRQERAVSEATVIVKAWGTWGFVSASSQGYLSPTHPGLFTSLTAGANQRELHSLRAHHSKPASWAGLHYSRSLGVTLTHVACAQWLKIFVYSDFSQIIPSKDKHIDGDSPQLALRDRDA